MEFEFAGYATNYLVLLGLVTPFLTAVLTKLRDPDWFKGLVSLAGAAAVGLFVEMQQVGLDAVELRGVIESAVAAFGVHLMSYFGVTKDMVANFAKLPSVVKMGPLSLNR